MSAPTSQWRGLIHLGIVYLVWGSTYLFIRIAVHEGSGFSPFTMAASRITVAAAILLPAVILLRMPWKVSKRDLVTLAASGALLWFGGNGLVALAEKRASSSFAALVIGSTPVWPVLVEAVLDRRRPSWQLVLGMLVSFAGLAVLLSPVLRQGIRADTVSALTLLLASFSWAAGSMLFQRRPVKAPPLVASAWQHVFGAIALCIAMQAAGDPAPNPTHAAWLAWVYLIVAGSLISFRSYLIAVQTLPMSVVMTYAYVNPVTAMILGRVFLGEKISGTMLAGMALILGGVAVIFRERLTRTRRQPVTSRA